MLEVRNLNKNYGELKALENINFTLDHEILGLIGPNGAGKTTLLESIAGFTAIDSGEILWNGRSSCLSERKKFIFYLPDGILPYEDDHVSRVLDFFSRLHCSSEDNKQIVLRELALCDVLHKRVSTLSKGYRKRLLLGLALLSQATVLFLDEPFDGLDLRQTLSVMALLKHISRSLFLSIHQLSDALKVCHRLLLINQGRIVAAGTAGELGRKARIQTGNLEEIFLALT